MKRLALAASCLALLVSLRPDAVAQAVPKDIRAYYARCAQAMEKRDIGALTKTLAPNVVAIDQKGRVQKGNEVIQSMTLAFSMLSDVHAKFTILSASVKGNHATVVNDVVLSGVVKNPQTGKTSRMKMKQHCKDILVKSAGGWLMEKTTTLEESTTVDGRPAPAG